jgi:hypothetical protein
MCFKLMTASIGEAYHTLEPEKRLIEVDTDLGSRYELRVGVSVMGDTYSFRYWLIPSLNTHEPMRELVTEGIFSARAEHSKANLGALEVVAADSPAWTLSKTVESTFKHVMGLKLFTLPQTL